MAGWKWKSHSQRLHKQEKQMVSSALIFQASSPSLFSMQFHFSKSLFYSTTNNTSLPLNIFFDHLHTSTQPPYTKSKRAWAAWQSAGASQTLRGQEWGSHPTCFKCWDSHLLQEFSMATSLCFHACWAQLDWVVDGYMGWWENSTWYAYLGHMWRLPRGGSWIYSLGWSRTTSTRVKH